MNNPKLMPCRALQQHTYVLKNFADNKSGKVFSLVQKHADTPEDDTWIQNLLCIPSEEAETHCVRPQSVFRAPQSLAAPVGYDVEKPTNRPTALQKQL